MLYQKLPVAANVKLFLLTKVSDGKVELAHGLISSFAVC